MNIVIEQVLEDEKNKIIGQTRSMKIEISYRKNKILR